MRKLTYIASAESTSIEDKLADRLDELKDNLDFAVAGIEKLIADGQMDDATAALDILSEYLDEVIRQVSSNIAE